ncbi:hypothetical protein AGMMS50230_21340 [Spirochaetia bacterium]|nr:hypothetical protein AGMMS50230_21340 [Spirochaetia bacterium]
MRIDNPLPEVLAECFTILERRFLAFGKPVSVHYLDLGAKVVRLINYSAEFIPHIEKQLTYVLQDSTYRDDTPDHYDVTLTVWKEIDYGSLCESFARCFDTGTDLLKRRVRNLVAGKRGDAALVPAVETWYQVFDKNYSRHHGLVILDSNGQIANAYNPVTNTYYYGVGSLEPEEFIKQGHIFVQFFNKILRTPDTNLAHGAVLSLNNKGVLFCARGQRGKSTLAVMAMLDGFDYVSDDYLVLGRDNTGLYADPIYSIITLSPMMYGDLYKIFNGKFVSNNARKDKYVFNIADYHGRFVKHCPIHLCMFTQIVSDPEPSIVACTQAGKGRAIVQLVSSTVNQMGDRHDTATVKKLIDFVKDFPFYQINLCRDIEKNLRCLRAFLLDGKCSQQQNAAGMFCSAAQ